MRIVDGLRYGGPIHLFHRMLVWSHRLYANWFELIVGIEMPSRGPVFVCMKSKKEKKCVFC